MPQILFLGMGSKNVEINLWCLDASMRLYVMTHKGRYVSFLTQQESAVRHRESKRLHALGSNRCRSWNLSKSRSKDATGSFVSAADAARYASTR